MLNKGFDKYDDLEKFKFHSDQEWQYQMKDHQKNA